MKIHFILKVKRKSSNDFGFLADSFEEHIVSRCFQYPIVLQSTERKIL